MAEPAPQRQYRAACPGCGAPVLFRSAQSSHAVCAYCHSTVVREGEVLKRLGKLAELFDDHSPLQLGASGRHQGMGFVVVGRIQYQSAQGPWTEWAVVQDDGQPATLSEDNGSYVFARPRTVSRPLPEPQHLRLGMSTAVEGRRYAVAFNDQVSLRAAEGELSHLPPSGQPFAWVELRSQGGPGPSTVLTLDYSPTLSGQPVAVSLGQEVRLEELHMQGLKDEVAKSERGRQFSCPACGAPVSVQLESTQRLSCASCHALIDLSQGVGAELVAARQSEPVEPLIALGSQGRFQGKSWQVVGFAHRMGTEPSDPDEHFGWNEYLLYHTQRGFQFLVDSTEGWSLVKPTTGSPELGFGGQTATYLGTTYRLQSAYHAETTYVAGEFYWPVQRGQRSFNRDFAAGNHLLNQEEAGREITWSVGSKLSAQSVADAFGLPQLASAAGLAKADAKPTSELSLMGKLMVLLFIVLLLVLLGWLSREDCNPNDPTQNCASSGSLRSSGGSWGGYSSGGGHK